MTGNYDSQGQKKTSHSSEVCLAGGNSSHEVIGVGAKTEFCYGKFYSNSSRKISYNHA